MITDDGDAITTTNVVATAAGLVAGGIATHLVIGGDDAQAAVTAGPAPELPPSAILPQPQLGPGGQVDGRS